MGDPGSDADAEELVAWVGASVAGDSSAFRGLYDRCADRVHRRARFLLGSPDVDDVVQDVFVRAWEKLPGLRDPLAFDSWLDRLAVHVILRRREQRHRLRGRELGLDESSPPPASTPTGAPGLRLDLERGVARLPPGARDVFVLYDMEGFSHKEIAAMLGISHHTSRSQLHRARALMRSYLEAAGA